MKRFFAFILICLVASSGVRSLAQDDQYVRIYTLIQEGDALSERGQASQALAKYLEAQTALRTFQKGYPDWNTTVINFRLKYLEDKISPLLLQTSAASTNASAKSVTGTTPGQPAKPAAPEDWEAQLRSLSGQVRQLQSDKALLEAKLKEALSVQPAAVDPGEMAKMEEKVKALQKERDLLSASLEAEKSKPPVVTTNAISSPGVGPGELAKLEEKVRALEKEKDQLSASLAAEKAKPAAAAQAAEANAREIVRLEEKLKSVEKEKDLLSTSLAAEKVKPTLDTNVLAQAQQALAQANRQLAELKESAARQTTETEALQTRLKAAPSPDDLAVLKVENKLLKKQLEDIKAAAPNQDASRQLTKAQTQIAVLQSDKEALRLEKLALENRLKEVLAGKAPATAVPAAEVKADDSARIKQLERERDDLQRQLEAANKRLASRKTKGDTARADQLEEQIATLRARLEVFEARQVPYTPEELALFKKPETKLAAPQTGTKSIRELPAGTATLVTEAKRYFASHQFDKAEDKYLQALRQDDNNAPAHTDLAVVELQLNRIDQAEKHVLQALELAPDNAYSLSILGQVKARQGKFDEAIDALSRAAKLEPENAELQVWLGLALSQKGLRSQAEAALRKAIQLQPGYGDAHYNLAVIYIAQQPPLVELAKWHYQRALAAGRPHDADLEKKLGN